MSWLWFVGLAGAAGFLALTWKGLVRLLVRARLGPYQVQVNRVDTRRPKHLSSRRTVAVIGGGLAGVSAACTLAARGFLVTLMEANTFLGGKVGSWSVTLPEGETEPVSHGFHAFFRHYYNLNRFLDAQGLRERFRSIGDYRILFPRGEELSFGKTDTTPVLNLLSLSAHGVYRLADALKQPTRDLMGVFLEYDPSRTFAQLDGMSFREFDRLAALPARLKLAFNTFARAFFADESKLSMAELVKSFHSYFLSHDGGLTYDYPDADYAHSLWAPIGARLSDLGVQVELGRRVQRLERVESGFRVDEREFDRVVLAADVPGTKAILERSVGLTGLDGRLSSVTTGQRYAVLRIWIDRAARADLPVFVITDRRKVLDAITFYERAEAEAAHWVARHGGSVLELHCYAVPDTLADGEVKELMLEELDEFLPELRGARVVGEHFQLRRDFPAFHVGQHARRPVTATGISGLVVAGDWVKLDFPAMLMEAAFSSGLVAANQLLTLEGLQEEPVFSVPLKGLLAGVPASPSRKKLLAGVVT